MDDKNLKQQDEKTKDPKTSGDTEPMASENLTVDTQETQDTEKAQEELAAPEPEKELKDPAEPKQKQIEAKEEEGLPASRETQVKTEEKTEKEEKSKAATPPSDKGHLEDSDQGKWYIIHTYSGHENKVAKSLRQRIESMGFENRIFDIIVPTRDTVKVSQGKKENVKEKIFPGYVLVKMILDDESWLLVRTTQGVTAFIGAGNKPTPISDKEVEAIQKFMATEEPLYKTAFTVGEAVKIVDGPFSDFLGTIDNIDEAKGKLKVLVSIFGRETPVELDFLQVSKL